MSGLMVFINEDGDYWVAVEDATQREARRVIASLAQETCSERVKYKGRVKVRLTEHEFDCSGEHEDGSCYREREAWHFVGLGS